MCIQCGTCSGSCPSAADMDHTPRQIFAMILAEMREEVLNSNAPWFCISCYLCTVRCPQGVQVTDLMYTLKSLAVKNNAQTDPGSADLSKSFASYVENYGRAFELGLATAHYLRHPSMRISGLAEIGFGMLSKGRLDLTPVKIQNLEQLQSILAKAKSMEDVDYP